MRAEENKILVDDIKEVLSGSSLRWIQSIDTNCPLYSNGDLMGWGPHSVASTFRQLRGSFPYLRWEVGDQCAEDQKVWTRYTATGRSQTITGVSICTVENGKIKRWDNWDTSAKINTLAAEHSDVDVIRAQQEREVALIQAQLNRNRTGAVSWAKLVGRSALVLILGALVIGGISISEGGAFNPGWVVPVAALIAAVAVVGMAALSFGSNRNDIIIRGDTKIPERSLGNTASLSAGTPAAGTPAASTPAASTPAASTPAAGTTMTPTTTASVAAQEPVIVTAVVTAILQVIVIAGFQLDAATQATIVGGLSALGGVFVRGRVSPVQTPVRTG